MAGDTGRVLFVEDNDDLREVLVELVEHVVDRRCMGVASYEELVALGEAALGSSVAIIDINLGPNRRSGIDVYRWLRDHKYRGRVVFLTGHASTHPLAVEAQGIGDAQVVSKPIEAEQLRSLIDGGR